MFWPQRIICNGWRGGIGQGAAVVSSAEFKGKGVDFAEKDEKTHQPTKVKSHTDRTILPL